MAKSQSESPEFREAVHEMAEAWEDLTQVMNELLNVPGGRLDGAQLVRSKAIDPSDIAKMRRIASELRDQASSYRKALED